MEGRIGSRATRPVLDTGSWNLGSMDCRLYVVCQEPRTENQESGAESRREQEGHGAEARNPRLDTGAISH